MFVNKLLRIHKIFTSAYHPQSDAKSERVVQEMKKALRMINITLDEEFTDIDNKTNINTLIKQITLLLPAIQFSINQKFHTITQVSPHMLLYGTNLRDIADHKIENQIMNELPKQFDNESKYELVKQLRVLLNSAKQQKDAKHEKYVIIMKDYHDLNKTEDDFEIGDLVAYYVGDRASTNKKLQLRFSGPWRVLKRLHHNTLVIKNTDDGEKLACHVCMLKHYHKGKFTPLSEYERSKKAVREA